MTLPVRVVILYFELLAWYRARRRGGHGCG